MKKLKYPENFPIGFTECELRILLWRLSPLSEWITPPTGPEQQAMSRALHKVRKTLAYVESQNRHDTCSTA
jgi:hypothetical protein